ncbi:hypothetical protein T4A_9723 [Trichinella pseudospiralis]|uniref:Uncharacterized protein n=1 Tax=Trichinella pseudospiralis TaxID=6337 RepID=A0A0V1EPA9_TRIPS|nr:hypothetical protein T4A_9723 [Trichinella pseudospiralis]KRZ39499.1 hypothetical protein T4C_7598 [Trichinella pseudospiralis]
MQYPLIKHRDVLSCLFLDFRLLTERGVLRSWLCSLNSSKQQLLQSTISGTILLKRSDSFVKVKVEQQLTCSTAKTKRVVSPAFIAMLLMVVVDALDGMLFSCSALYESESISFYQSKKYV